MSTADLTAAEIEGAGGSLVLLLELVERLHRWQRPAYNKARKERKGIAEALQIAIKPINYIGSMAADAEASPPHLRHALFDGKA